MIFRLDEQCHVVVLEGIKDKRLLDLIRSDCADGQELPGERILFILQNISTNFYCEIGAMGDFHVSGDAERSESFQVSVINFNKPRVG